MEQSHQLTVHKSRDYSLFKTLTGNRQLSLLQIKRLTKTLSRFPLFTKIMPILVNEKMEVIDGQHRLAAYKAYKEETGVDHPIYFIVNKELGLAEARNLNAGSKPWSPIDYAMAYSSGGNKEYSTYIKFWKATGLNNEILVRYLSPNNYSMTDFRDGNFTIPDEKKSQRWLDNLEEVGAVTRQNMANPIDYRHRSFALGLLNLMLNKNYDQERMLEQLELDCRSLRTTDMRNEDISRALQSIYNKKQEEKVSLIN